MRHVATDGAPMPAGHYSQAVEHGAVVYVSAQLPLTPSGVPLAGSSDVDSQTAQVLQNINSILLAAGSCRQNVLRVCVYVNDIAHWPVVNDRYKKFFGDHKPARSVVEVSGLHFGCSVAMDAVAFVDDTGDRHSAVVV
ncbi:RidA family protein [Parafrankia elaeagni]|uniref:RidA family protein n=1 Tax=Parafrankia elaeagni TaxID=222534 RepID=UPI0009FF7EE5|nr:Rid family detoxifying hydrolase [Parafrankia elaeagni]